MKLRVRGPTRVWVSLSARFVIAFGGALTGAMVESKLATWPSGPVYLFAVFVGLVGAATALELYLEEADDARASKPDKPAK